MTSQVRRGLAVAVVHVLLVAILAGKLYVDRMIRPRAWARAAPVDPNLPIRGRYVRLRLEAAVAPGLKAVPPPASTQVRLAVEGDRLVAMPSPEATGLYAHTLERDGQHVAVLEQPLAYFIPEHVPDPSLRGSGEELWVEVTLPAKGAPRPIRLGVKKGGVLTPLDLN